MAFALIRASCRLSAPLAWTPCGSVRAFSGAHFFGEFADLFSADKPHVAATIRTFEAIHELSGMPWWGSILAGGVLLRTVTCFPLHVLSEANIARVINAQPKMAEINESLVQKAAELSGDKDAKLKLKRTRRQAVEAVYQADNCHPLYSMLCQLLQFPIWLSASFGVRHLCGFGVDCLPPAAGITSGGFGWMTDLTAPDPFFVLPAVVFALNVANHELNNLTAVVGRTPNRNMVIFKRVVSVTVSGGLCVLACFLPQGMILYWFVSSLHLLLLRVLFLYPGVKRAFRIPSTPLDLERPLHTMWENAKRYPLLRRLSGPKDSR